MRGRENTLKRLHEACRDTPRGDFVAGGGPFLVTSLSLGPTSLDTTLVFELTGGERRSGRIAIGADDVAESPQESVVTRYDLGRATECHVAIPCGSVSKRHACLVERDELWAVSDLDSRNGTRLDGQALPPSKPVRITTTPARLDLGPDASLFFITRADMYDFLVKVREAMGEPVTVGTANASRRVDTEVEDAHDDDATGAVGSDPDLGLLAAYETQKAEVLGEDTDERRFELALTSLESMGDGLVQTIEATISGAERGLVLSPGKGTTVKAAAAILRRMATVVDAFQVTLAIGSCQPIELYKKN